MNIKRVLLIGTGIATTAYMLCGIFGYVTFSKNPNIDKWMSNPNQLLFDYGHEPIIHVCLILFVVCIFFASPFCVLPAKDSFEELLMKDQKKFTSKLNFLCTFGIVVFAWFITYLLDSLSDVLGILGPTTNTGIGFLIPVVFYLKLKGQENPESNSYKIVPYCVFIFLSICSVLELYSYIYSKIN